MKENSPNYFQKSKVHILPIYGQMDSKTAIVINFGIDANLNNNFGLFANHYFINISIQEHSEIKLVKIDDPEEALEYGLKQLPSLVFFENQMPNMFDGNLENSKQVLTWIIEIAMQDKIELVSGAMLEKLVEEKTNLAVFVHDK